MRAHRSIRVQLLRIPVFVRTGFLKWKQNENYRVCIGPGSLGGRACGRPGSPYGREDDPKSTPLHARYHLLGESLGVS